MRLNFLFFSTMMSSLGAEIVAEASDTEKAWRLYQQWSPDMVTVDIHMPKLDGI